MDGAHARESWNFSDAEDSAFDRKTPPKRSLDGAPSRVMLWLEFLAWATRPGPALPALVPNP